jgi:GntR family transcriptional regulator of arabinose operon
MPRLSRGKQAWISGKSLYNQVVSTVKAELPKYQQIIEQLRSDIRSGKYSKGERLPSESELVGVFSTSRVTVNRALRELQLGGLIERRAGSGSYVSRSATAKEYVFGLLIPELGRTEIFEPICRGMAEARDADHHTLLWGKSFSDCSLVGEEVESLCRQFISKKVSGVFFAPLELTPEKDVTNRNIVDILDRAGIPVVLLDRDLVAYPARSRYDLVGIDNRRAGYTITEHLIKAGAKKLVFIGRPGSASTVDARVAGFREAIQNSDMKFSSDLVVRIEPWDKKAIQRLHDRIHPDGIVCANDFTAAHVMKVLTELGIPVPAKVRIGGFDDVKYATLLPVSLTTIHQACNEMGAAAIETMVQRLQHGTFPGRDVLLNFRLIVRRSSGTDSQLAETTGAPELSISSIEAPIDSHRASR